MRSLFGHRDFRLLLLGQSTSTIGLVFVALALYVTDIGSPSDVGIVLASHAVPLVGFLLIGGVWADRLPRHLVVVTTDLIRFGLHALLAALIFTGHGRAARGLVRGPLAHVDLGDRRGVLARAADRVRPVDDARRHDLDRALRHARVYGILASALGAGTIVGALIGFRWRPRFPMRTGMLLALPLPIALAALAAALTSREVWNLRSTAAAASR
jgi:hypothetical protein